MCVHVKLAVSAFATFLVYMCVGGQWGAPPCAMCVPHGTAPARGMQVLGIPSLGCIACFPSLLPKHAGASPVQVWCTPRALWERVPAGYLLAPAWPAPHKRVIAMAVDHHPRGLGHRGHLVSPGTCPCT